MQIKHIKFLQTRDRFIVLHQDPNEMPLYHGTSGTETSLIYIGAEGLDFRLARRGFLGRSNFLAKCIVLAGQYYYLLPR